MISICFESIILFCTQIIKYSTVSDELSINTTKTIQHLQVLFMTVLSKNVLDVSKLNECGEVYATPILHNNRIYFGALDKYFYCIDIDSGQKIWELKTDNL
ncbi:MAG: PQQ-binding-like beta-propeller repeat protein, partial [Candidatus Aenigmarchaeota archaeon]|nr:PQQ-binding-like beta-propeller repeat protein [Candidatus Aenigmarchaeota archaeon]